MLKRDFCAIFCLQIIGIWIYTSGFLQFGFLSDKINHSRIFANDTNSAALASTKKFDRVVVLLVDALRYDMINPYPSFPQEKTPKWVNRVPIIQQILQQRTSQSILYKFHSDPPTVTTPRLKSLTVGNIPLFMDIGSSFTSPSISSDNLLLQLAFNSNGLLRQNFSDSFEMLHCPTQKRSLWMAGDDSWITLYPNNRTSLLGKFQNSKRTLANCVVWEKTVEIPSFDVKDLDSNDAAVFNLSLPLLRSIQQSLKRTSYETEKFPFDGLIAHLLGVDHTSHQKGLDNTKVSSKLDQVDSFIRLLVEAIDAEQELIIREAMQLEKTENTKLKNMKLTQNSQNISTKNELKPRMRQGTLLVVMGDHGITEGGSHGGDKKEEKESALFMYSPRPLLALMENENAQKSKNNNSRTRYTNEGDWQFRSNAINSEVSFDKSKESVLGEQPSYLKEDPLLTKDHATFSNGSECWQLIQSLKAECENEEDEEDYQWIKQAKKSTLKKHHIEIKKELKIEGKLNQENENRRKIEMEELDPIYIQQQQHCRRNGSAYSHNRSIYPSVSQIDFVPTLSLLLGSSVPHSSAGRLMSEWATVLSSEEVLFLLKEKALAGQTLKLDEKTELQKSNSRINATQIQFENNDDKLNELLNYTFSSFVAGVTQPAIVPVTYETSLDHDFHAIHQFASNMNKKNLSEFDANYLSLNLSLPPNSTLTGFYNSSATAMPRKVEELHVLRKRMLPQPLLSLDPQYIQKLVEMKSETFYSLYHQHPNNFTTSQEQFTQKGENASLFVDSLAKRALTMLEENLQQQVDFLEEYIQNQPKSALARSVQREMLVEKAKTLLNISYAKTQQHYMALKSEKELIQKPALYSTFNSSNRFENDNILRSNPYETNYFFEKDAYYHISNIDLITQLRQILKKIQTTVRKSWVQTDRLKMLEGFIIIVLSFIAIFCTDKKAKQLVFIEKVSKDIENIDKDEKLRIISPTNLQSFFSSLPTPFSSTVFFVLLLSLASQFAIYVFPSMRIEKLLSFETILQTKLTSGPFSFLTFISKQFLQIVINLLGSHTILTIITILWSLSIIRTPPRLRSVLQNSINALQINFGSDDSDRSSFLHNSSVKHSPDYSKTNSNIIVTLLSKLYWHLNTLWIGFSSTCTFPRICLFIFVAQSISMLTSSFIVFEQYLHFLSVTLISFGFAFASFLIHFSKQTKNKSFTNSGSIDQKKDECIGISRSRLFMRMNKLFSSPFYCSIIIFVFSSIMLSTTALHPRDPSSSYTNSLSSTLFLPTTSTVTQLVNKILLFFMTPISKQLSSILFKFFGIKEDSFYSSTPNKIENNHIFSIVKNAKAILITIIKWFWGFVYTAAEALILYVFEVIMEFIICGCERNKMNSSNKCQDNKLSEKKKKSDSMSKNSNITSGKHSSHSLNSTQVQSKNENFIGRKENSITDENKLPLMNVLFFVAFFFHQILYSFSVTDPSGNGNRIGFFFAIFLLLFTIIKFVIFPCLFHRSQHSSSSNLTSATNSNCSYFTHSNPSANSIRYFLQLIICIGINFSLVIFDKKVVASFILCFGCVVAFCSIFRSYILNGLFHKTSSDLDDVDVRVDGVQLMIQEKDEVSSVIQKRMRSTFRPIDPLPCIFLFALSSLLFFSTGHHAAFSTIDLNTGFLLSSSFDPANEPITSFFSASITFLNTFYSSIFFVTFIKIYSLWEWSVGSEKLAKEQENLKKKEKETPQINTKQTTSQNEFPKSDQYNNSELSFAQSNISVPTIFLHHASNNVIHPYFVLSSILITLPFLCLLLFIVLFPTHPFIFSVFAPKYCFATISQIFTMLLLLFAC
ncbi:putative gpi ethanolamine phosphate transferase [Monocercomonoides exilis]|uniref:putative gpi ethanolamine phosphate transferase n=1 Tax=Monocercomonoides exilis TaxID=2049356 RepID=UPI00355AB914|nr:putative gpi ethanolamine phosphate transferase [Monocercomonoides exilis]